MAPNSPPPRPQSRGPQTVTRDTITWKIIDDPLTHALSENDIHELASSHSIDAELLRKLSGDLRSTFQPDPRLLQPELAADRKKAGQKKFKQANDLVRSAEDKLRRASIILKDIGFVDPFVHTGMPNPGTQRLEAFETARQVLAECGFFFSVMEREGYARLLSTPDARKATDVRRTILCVTLFNLWLDLERKLTYTTDPISGERKGSLIEFVNDVVERLTDPSTRLSGEAIKRELDDFLA